MEQITTLFQPVRFKREKKSKWERGIKQISKSGTVIIDYKEQIVEHVYKFEVDWFNKLN